MHRLGLRPCMISVEIIDEIIAWGIEVLPDSYCNSDPQHYEPCFVEPWLYWLLCKGMRVARNQTDLMPLIRRLASNKLAQSMIVAHPDTIEQLVKDLLKDLPWASS